MRNSGMPPHLCGGGCHKGHDGFGVTVATGGGDGLYPVYVKRSREGLVGEVRVVFIPEDV